MVLSLGMGLGFRFCVWVLGLDFGLDFVFVFGFCVLFFLYKLNKYNVRLYPYIIIIMFRFKVGFCCEFSYCFSSI